MKLYHMAKDPTELHDLAGQDPERVTRMSAEWHRMTKDVLLAPKSEQAPVATKALPKAHQQWSRYSGTDGDHTGSR